MFAVLYIKVLYKTGDIFRLFIKAPDILKPGLGGLMVGLIGIYFPQIFGLGYETIGDVLQNQMPFILVFTLVFIKLIATSLTLGSGSPGGDFAPGLFMGAMLGGAFGLLVNYLFPGMIAPPGAYALAGMGGVLAGQYQAPITAIIILLEMTNDYIAILPLAVVCIISPLVARKLYPETIYTEKLARKCIHLKNKGIFMFR
jgi:CIC family chloride channel protein